MTWVTPYVQELGQLNTEFEAEFGSLDAAQMDFKPDAKTWSINECLDHIRQTNSVYYPIFEGIGKGSYRASRWRHIPVLPRALGRWIVKIVSPEYKGKAKTTSDFFPTRSQYGDNQTAALLAANKELATKFRLCEDAAPDETIVTSPALRLVAYSLRECVHLLVAHEKRHLQQALRMKALAGETN